MGRSDTVDYAHFIGLNHQILESTDAVRMGEAVEDQKIRRAMERQEEVERITGMMKESVYEVYVPVYVDAVKIAH